jgi:hypothetical protein
MVLIELTALEHAGKFVVNVDNVAGFAPIAHSPLGGAGTEFLLAGAAKSVQCKEAYEEVKRLIQQKLSPSDRPAKYF